MSHSVSDGKLRASVRSVAGVGGVAGSCSYGVTLGASCSGLDSPSCASEGEVGPASQPTGLYQLYALGSGVS